MAEGEPPYAEEDRVKDLILNNDSPQLRSNTWSPCFVSFLDSCLKKDPTERWSAKELLQHPFITGLPPKRTIRAEIKEHLQAVHNWPEKKSEGILYIWYNCTIVHGEAARVGLIIVALGIMNNSRGTFHPSMTF
eukprot:XP_017951146.1 PREDICTED: serine/threonine-protein kinase 3-like [Xenopus tropicalis]